MSFLKFFIRFLSAFILGFAAFYFASKKNRFKRYFCALVFNYFISIPIHLLHSSLF